MKKRIIGLSITMIMAASLIACGGSDDSSSTQKNKTATPAVEATTEAPKAKSSMVDNINLDNSEGTLIYTKHEVTKDYEGKPAILIYFDYTNKKDDTSYAQMTFYPQVFQNGVECEIAILDNKNESIENAYKEIQKGTTLNIALAYNIQDESNVTLKVSDQSSENLFDDIYQEQELALK